MEESFFHASIWTWFFCVTYSFWPLIHINSMESFLKNHHKTYLELLPWLQLQLSVTHPTDHEDKTTESLFRAQRLWRVVKDSSAGCGIPVNTTKLWGMLRECNLLWLFQEKSHQVGSFVTRRTRGVAKLLCVSSGTGFAQWKRKKWRKTQLRHHIKEIRRYFEVLNLEPEVSIRWWMRLSCWGIIWRKAISSN